MVILFRVRTHHMPIGAEPSLSDKAGNWMTAAVVCLVTKLATCLVHWIRRILLRDRLQGKTCPTHRREADIYPLNISHLDISPAYFGYHGDVECTPETDGAFALHAVTFILFESH